MALTGTTYTLQDVLDDINANIREAADSLWTPSQKVNAVQKAVKDASPEWWEERIDDKHTYDYTDFRYSLPPACVVVEEIRFESLSSFESRKIIVPSDWHIESDELIFEDSFDNYNGYSLYVIYLHYQYNLLDVSGASGEVDSTGLTFTDTGTSWESDGVKPGDAIVIDSDDRYIVADVVSDTELTLRTEATTNTGLTYTIAYYTDIPHEYLVNKAMAELYMASLINRPSIEIENSMQLSDYYRQLAEQALQRRRKHPKARRRY